MLTPKFADAFNACADKIVNAAELMKLSFAEYAGTLSPKEQDLVTSIKTKTAAVIQTILSDSLNRQKLLSAVGDGTLGLYVSADHQVFINAKFVRFMEESMRGDMKLHLSPDLLTKLDNADADALLKAPDYKDRAAALRLRAVV